jgi:hypothetical protein
VSGRVVQKGPAFPRPLDMTINGTTGQVIVRYTNDKGEEKVEDEHVDIPADLANGMILTLLKNVQPNALPKSISLVAATPKPRLVKLAISAAGQEKFATGGAVRTATHYVVKVEIGGLSGLVAPLVGKQPPDSHVWILGGQVPRSSSPSNRSIWEGRCGGSSSQARSGRARRSQRSEHAAN